MNTLIRMFDCRETINGIPYNNTNLRLMYTFTFEDRRVVLSEELVRNTLVAEWLQEGINSPNISVCRSNYRSRVCNASSIPVMIDLGSVEIDVEHNSARLFLYGNLTRDLSFHGVTDGVAETHAPLEEIPFFSGYYRNLYVSKVY